LTFHEERFVHQENQFRTAGGRGESTSTANTQRGKKTDTPERIKCKKKNINKYIHKREETNKCFNKKKSISI